MFPRGNLHNQRFFTIGHSIGQSFPVVSPSCLCHLPTSLRHVLLGIPTFRLPCGYLVIHLTRTMYRSCYHHPTQETIPTFRLLCGYLVIHLTRTMYRSCYHHPTQETIPTFRLLCGYLVIHLTRTMYRSCYHHPTQETIPTFRLLCGYLVIHLTRTMYRSCYHHPTQETIPIFRLLCGYLVIHLTRTMYRSCYHHPTQETIPIFRLLCGYLVITSHTHYVSLMLSSSDPRNHSHISFTLRISCYHISHALCIAHVIIIRPKKPFPHFVYLADTLLSHLTRTMYRSCYHHPTQETIPTFRLPCGYLVIISHTHYVSLMLSSSDPRNHSHISFTLRIPNNDLKCAMSDHPFSDFLRKTVMPEMGRGST